MFLINLLWPLCSCSVIGGEGVSRQGPDKPRWLSHPAVSGIRFHATLLPLVQGGWAAHLEQCWATQTRSMPQSWYWDIYESTTFLTCGCNGRNNYSGVCQRYAGAELYFSNVQPSDAGVYICTCRDQRSTNRSHAEIVVTSVYESCCHEMLSVRYNMHWSAVITGGVIHTVILQA